MIEDNATVDRSLLATGVTIKRGAHVQAGSVLSFNTVIGEGFATCTHAVITICSESDAEEAEDADEDADEEEEVDDDSSDKKDFG